MFGSAFQPAPQPRRKPINRFARGHALDLSTNEPTIDVETGLRDHRSIHCRITMPGQFDAGVQHRSMGEPPKLADLATRIISRTGKHAARCHIDLEDKWQF